jgi:Arc/MetJ family transcription regulator
MAATRPRHRRGRVQRKNYRIDVAKLARTQKILGTRTETETIHRALDLVADEGALIVALRNFVLKGGGHIEDIDARR